jgi:hypothetical protein
LEPERRSDKGERGVAKYACRCVGINPARIA